jgi:hypothetical protein
MVGTGLGARRGVLFKNAIALENSARIEAVVMDKTGTLTKGEPEVTDVIADGLPEPELLAVAAAVERSSEHPLAEAIVHRAEADGAQRLDASAFENVPGHGALATVGGRRVAIGNHRLMERESVELGGLAGRREELAAGGTGGAGRPGRRTDRDRRRAAPHFESGDRGAPRGRCSGRHADRGQRGHGATHRRRTRNRHRDGRGAARRQGGQDRRAAGGWTHGGHGRGRRQRRAGTGAGRPRHRNRRGHRRGDRDGRMSS